MPSDIVVSVVCNAYNHAPYIRQCLEGLVAQEADFDYEILVHDDASTDGTADIIREFEARYPRRIKPIYQTENQYSRGGVMRFQIPRARGKYVALCEGDDCWTDPKKLQKQVAAMEAHPGIDLCAHATRKLDGVTGRHLSDIAPLRRDAVIPAEAVIEGGGLFVATSSLLFRASLNDDVPPFRSQRKTDYTLQIHGALRGGMLYLKDNMSVYRFRAPGSWSQKVHDSPAQNRQFLERVTAMLRQLDADTGGKYHASIERRIARYACEDMIRARDFRALARPENAESLKALPPLKRCAVRLCAVFPGLYDGLKRARRLLRRI